MSTNHLTNRAPQLLSKQSNLPLQAIIDPGFESGLRPKSSIGTELLSHHFHGTESSWTYTCTGRTHPALVDVIADPAQVNYGNYSLRADGGGLSDEELEWSVHVEQDIAVEPDHEYRLEIWAKQRTASVCTVEGYWKVGGNVVLKFTPARHWTKAWTQVEVGDTTSGMVGVTLRCRGGSGSDTIWLDDITFTDVL